MVCGIAKQFRPSTDPCRWFCEAADGKRRRTISEQQQRDFYNKEFVFTEYNNLSPEQEEDLFARVQMGMQLNLAEKMRASTGPWQELARLFVEGFDSVCSLMKDRARLKDFQLTLACFSQIVEYMHPTAANGIPILKTSYTQIPKLLSNKDAVDDGLESHLASVWNTFQDLVQADPNTFANGNKYLRGVQTFAPVEMVAVTALISVYSETRNNRLLLGDIQAMRTAIRENFIDLRLNATVWRWCWEYIDNLEAIRGAIDGSTVDRRTKQRTEKDGTTPVHGVTAGSTAASITAAAAASKRGRKTARTKRPAPAVGIDIPVAVKQELTASGSPSAKRQRTGDTCPGGSTVGNGQPQTLLSSSTSPGLPQNRQSQELHYSPMPTYASTRSSLPTARRAHQTTSAATSAASPSVHDGSSSTETKNRWIYPRHPSEASQQRITTLNSYQSVPRPDRHRVADGPSHFSGPPTGADPRVPIAPMISRPSTSRLDPSPFQLDGSKDSAIPAKQVASPPQPVRKAEINTPRHNRRQMDNVIDLTDDTEQARQDLLSSLKSRPKFPAQQRPRIKTELMRTSQELPTRSNNPYAVLRRD
jgi:hypothetical protein